MAFAMRLVLFILFAGLSQCAGHATTEHLDASHNASPSISAASSADAAQEHRLRSSYPFVDMSGAQTAFLNLPSNFAIVSRDGTTAFIGIGPCATNTVLLGQGASSAAICSVYTIAGPGTSGNVLTSDGTNWTSATPNTSPPRAYFGDGSDGVATFDGSATPAGVTKNSASLYTLNRDVYYTNASVSTGVNVFTNGWRFFARGTVTLTGTSAIEQNGNLGNVNNGGIATASHTINGTFGGANGPGTSGTAGIAGSGCGFGGFGGSGGNGGSSSTGCGSGCAGGLGGQNSAPTTGGPRSTPEATLGQYLDSPTSTGGQNLMRSICGGGSGGSGGRGSADGSTAPGGGGAGGGVVVVAAYTITGSGNIQALGGQAGSATNNSGAGGGGGGGVILLVYGTNTGWTGTGQVTGGAGGTGGANPGSAGLTGFYTAIQG